VLYGNPRLKLALNAAGKPSAKSPGQRSRRDLGSFDFYNTKRPHQSLDGATPDQAYFTLLPLRAAA
jgi:hypothetical protein